MELKITQITVEENVLTPTLRIDTELTFPYYIEAPLYISGTLKTSDGKIIAYLNEQQVANNNDKDMLIKSLNEAERANIYNTKNTDRYFANLTAVLSHSAIEHIELCREKHPNKDVMLTLNFIVKAIRLSGQAVGLTTHLNVSTGYGHYIITHSDWFNKYADKLGIGNFILLELQIPEKKTVKPEWTETYDRLAVRLQEMREEIKKGEWQSVMESGRKFYENLKISDKKPATAKLQNDLKTLFIKEGHTEEGFNDLLAGIRSFFDFISKYIHDLDKKGEMKPIPIATKEDAYLVYTLGIGILNIIGRKLSKK